MFLGQAPAKCILLGEHVGAYGGSALCVPLNDRLTRVQVEPSKNMVFMTTQKGNPERLMEALKVIYRVLEKEMPTMTIRLHPSMPPGAGAGMSASIVKALTIALAKMEGVKLSKSMLLKTVLKTEKMFHGRTSSIDAATILSAKPVVLEAKKGRNVELPLLPPLALVFTGKPNESTADMVEHVSTQHELIREGVELSRVLVDELMKAKDSLPLVNQYGRFLERLGIVRGPEVRFLETLRERGYGAKVTGAGGQTGGSGLLCVLGEGDGSLPVLAKKYGYTVV